jgi:hypothetical protein
VSEPPAATPNFDPPAAPFYLNADDIPEFIDTGEEIAAQFKKGYKTTEFWSAIGVGALAFVNGVFDLGLNVEEIITAGVAVLGYGLSRGYLKGKRAEALASAAPKEVLHSMQ